MKLPPTEDELYAAELTQTMKDRDRLAKMEDEKETARLVKAREPEALEALKATAAFQGGVPVNDHTDTEEGDSGVVAAPKKAGRPRKADRKSTFESRSAPEPGNGAKSQDELFELAHKLMDECWKKWAVAAKKSPREAFRQLALDLGRDTSLYLRAGVTRAPDWADLMIKFMALPKAKEDEIEGAENFDENMEDLRKMLRGNG